MIKNKIFELESSLNTGTKNINDTLLKSVPDTMVEKGSKLFDINDVFNICENNLINDDFSDERFLELLLKRNLNQNESSDEMDIDELIKQEKQKIKELNITMADILVKMNILKEKKDIKNVDLKIEDSDEYSAIDKYLYKHFDDFMNKFIIPFENLKF